MVDACHVYFYKMLGSLIDNNASYFTFYMWWSNCSRAALNGQSSTNSTQLVQKESIWVNAVSLFPPLRKHQEIIDLLQKCCEFICWTKKLNFHLQVLTLPGEPTTAELEFSKVWDQLWTLKPKLENKGGKNRNFIICKSSHICKLSLLETKSVQIWID